MMSNNNRKKSSEKDLKEVKETNEKKLEEVHCDKDGTVTYSPPHEEKITIAKCVPATLETMVSRSEKIIHFIFHSPHKFYKNIFGRKMW